MDFPAKETQLMNNWLKQQQAEDSTLLSRIYRQYYELFPGLSETVMASPWESGKTYRPGDMATVETELYICSRENTGLFPLFWEEAWQLIKT
jgi:hypothetical protein